MIVTRIVSRVARETGVAAALGRALDAVIRLVDVQAILDRLDLTSIVLDRVDLERVVREVVKQLDEEELRSVLSRVDVDAILDRMDLTEIVLDRVDLRAVVDATLAYIDLVGLSERVIDELDLPEMIRESTDSMASDTVESIRVQGMDADRAVNRAVNRLLLRRERASDEPRS